MVEESHHKEVIDGGGVEEGQIFWDMRDVLQQWKKYKQGCVGQSGSGYNFYLFMVESGGLVATTTSELQFRAKSSRLLYCL